MKKLLFIALISKQFNFIDWKGVISDVAATQSAWLFFSH